MATWTFRYEKWSDPVGGIAGTIRTVPENYYVGTVMVDGTLDLYDRMEANTRNIKESDIRAWWKTNKNHYDKLVTPRQGEAYKFDREGIPTKISKKTQIRKPAKTARKHKTATTLGGMR